MLMLTAASELSSDTKRRLQLIAELDLEPIAFKLVHPEPHVTAMTIEEADRRILLYRRFLTLNLLHPECAIVPSHDIDSVWHTHILDTMKYAEDCELIFGFFLHHFPYVGLRGPEDEASWREQIKETRRLFKKVFGCDMLEDGASCGDQCDSGDDPGACRFPRGADLERPRLVRS